MKCNNGLKWVNAVTTFARGHSTRTFVVQVGRGESLKRKRKRTGGKGVLKPICTFAWIFKEQTEFFLESCLTVARSFDVLSLVQNIRCFFFCFSLFTPRFFIQKFINVAEFYLRGWGRNSLKRTYVEGGACKTNNDEQRGQGNQKLEISNVLFEYPLTSIQFFRRKNLHPV